MGRLTRRSVSPEKRAPTSAITTSIRRARPFFNATARSSPLDSRSPKTAWFRISPSRHIAPTASSTPASVPRDDANRFWQLLPERQQSPPATRRQNYYRRLCEHGIIRFRLLAGAFESEWLSRHHLWCRGQSAYLVWRSERRSQRGCLSARWKDGSGRI